MLSFEIKLVSLLLRYPRQRVGVKRLVGRGEKGAAFLCASENSGEQSELPFPPFSVGSPYKEADGVGLGKMGPATWA